MKITEESPLEFDVSLMEKMHMTEEEGCLAVIQKIYPHAKYVPTSDGRQLIFVDNGKSILGVAHLDGTMPAEFFYIGCESQRPGDILVRSPFVDDRLGAYTILHLIQQVGVECDLLFSVGEEIGQPTSQDFAVPKGRVYKWMFMFDRMGTDAVHYQYTNHDWLTALETHFEDVQVGMFSDIAYMDHVGCQGVNIGTGYHQYTTYQAWASLSQLESQV
jgi:hypothetical protein